VQMKEVFSMILFRIFLPSAGALCAKDPPKVTSRCVHHPCSTPCRDVEEVSDQERQVWTGLD
jgi:hypothetical protein